MQGIGATLEDKSRRKGLMGEHASMCCVAAHEHLDVLP